MQSGSKPPVKPGSSILLAEQPAAAERIRA
eukprot:SAG22_NODE_2496_length_2510_cov_2.147657_4_plen_29_part_01